MAFGINFYYLIVSQSTRILLAVDSLGAVGALFLVFGDFFKFARFGELALWPVARISKSERCSHALRPASQQQ